MACYVPEYLPEDYLTSEDGPAAAVRAVYYEKDALTHRDFLGSLMGAGIKRETVGDIYVSAGQCDILVTRQILPYLLEQWDSAGRTKLHLSVIPLAEVQRPAVESGRSGTRCPRCGWTVWWGRPFRWREGLPDS